MIWVLVVGRMNTNVIILDFLVPAQCALVVVGQDRDGNGGCEVMLSFKDLTSQFS